MKSQCDGSHNRLLGVIAGLGILMILLTLPTALFAQQGPAVFPSDSTPFGMTYGDWATAWFQYAFSIPASENPLLDTTGVDCGVGQSSDPVFFLAESCMIAGGKVTRSCTVPAGKALLAPITVVECSTVDPPPFQVNDGQEARTCAANVANGIGLNTLHLSIDGVKIPGLQHYRAQSPFYTFVMPAEDNIFGLNGVTSGVSGADGYWVMLKPLSPGSHVLHFGGDYASGPMAGLNIDVMYNLTVE
jgi:hypothetical protein